jgi:hypothetical protein
VSRVDGKEARTDEGGRPSHRKQTKTNAKVGPSRNSAVGRQPGTLIPGRVKGRISGPFERDLVTLRRSAEIGRYWDGLRLLSGSPKRPNALDGHYRRSRVMVKPDESGVLDASMQCRRNWQLRWAGIALAFANFGICYLALFIGPFNGWLVTGMMFFAIVHIPITLLFVIICILIPYLRYRGGMVTVVLALLPWVEWTAMIVFLSPTVHSEGGEGRNLTPTCYLLRLAVSRTPLLRRLSPPAELLSNVFCPFSAGSPLKAGPRVAAERKTGISRVRR